MLVFGTNSAFSIFISCLYPWDDSDADLPTNQPQQIRDPSASSSGGGASSSSDAMSSNSANRTDGRVRARLVSDFQYPVDVHFLRAMKEGTTHEWTNYELRFLCRKHGLNRRGKKAELLPRLSTHFSQLYKESLPTKWLAGGIWDLHSHGRARGLKVPVA